MRAELRARPVGGASRLFPSLAAARRLFRAAAERALSRPAQDATGFFLCILKTGDGLHRASGPGQMDVTY